MTDATGTDEPGSERASTKRTTARKPNTKPGTKRTAARKPTARKLSADDTTVSGPVTMESSLGHAASGRRRSLDPQGRRALFETPVSAARDTLRSGRTSDGKDALFSTGPRQPGTVVVTCSECEARSRINLTDLGLRWLSGTAWIPGRRNGHWMRCPSCHKRTWCAIGWQD